MAQTILLKRRTSDATAPSASDLTTGEVAVNAYSGKLYIKKTDGTVTEVSGSGGGGSSFPAVYNTYKYTATNGQTTFVGNDSSSNLLTYNVGNLIVFLNGVLLVPTTDYVATTGNTVVLQDGATTNDILTIVAFTATIGDGNVAVDTFSGDGSTTAFTLAANPQNENNTQVFIDGIYQSKSNYAVSGTTLTFSTAPPNNTSIEVTTGSREVTQYTATTLSLPNAGMSITGGDLDIPSDSRKIKLGASNDLQIFHDGTNNYIQGGTGDLRIDAKSGERGIVVTPDGATTLYYDNAAKLATVTGGVTITGTATATTFVGALTGNVTGNVSGTSGSTTGNAATATALANARTIGGTSFDGTANIVPATAVAVTGAAQSAITSVGTLTGLTSTGAVNITGAINSSADTTLATFGRAGSAVSSSIIYADATTDMEFGTTTSHSLNLITADTRRLTINNSGNVGIGTTDPTTDITKFGGSAVGLSVAGGQPVVVVRATGNAQHVGYLGQSGDDTYLGALGGGDLYIQTGTGGTTKMTIQAGGKVGIGETTPLGTLHVRSTDSGATADASADDLVIENNSNTGISILSGTSSTGSIYFGDSDRNWDGYIAYAHGTSPTMTIASNGGGNYIKLDATGSVGFSTTPTAWSSGYKSIQIGARGFVGAHTGSDLYVGQNAYFDSAWKYEASVAASLTQHSGGQITHKVAAAGTANNAITWNNALHITADAKIGIGGTSPQNSLHIFGDSGDSRVQFTNSTSGNAYADGFWVGMDNTQAYLLQRENQAISFFTNATKKMAITAGGNVEIEDGNLIFASGHGIDFSATANTTNASNISELLDDYEEGTFTPEMHVEGEGQATVSNAHGIYVLVGKMVTITLRADISNPPSAASNKAWEFRNLPFTSSGHGSELYTPASIRLSGLAASHTSGWQAFLFHGSNYGRIEFFNGQNPGNASTYMNGARTHLQVTYVIS